MVTCDDGTAPPSDASHVAEDGVVFPPERPAGNVRGTD